MSKVRLADTDKPFSNSLSLLDVKHIVIPQLNQEEQWILKPQIVKSFKVGQSTAYFLNSPLHKAQFTTLFILAY